jgi:hypothetical protein
VPSISQSSKAAHWLQKAGTKHKTDCHHLIIRLLTWFIELDRDSLRSPILGRTLQRLIVLTIPDNLKSVEEFDYLLLKTFFSLHFAPYTFLYTDQRWSLEKDKRKTFVNPMPALQNKHNPDYSYACRVDRSHPWHSCQTCMGLESYCLTCEPERLGVCKRGDWLQKIVDMMPYVSVIDTDEGSNLTLLTKLQNLARIGAEMLTGKSK